MKKIGIEIKWALIFIIMGFLWMLLERLTGLHGEHIDKHPIYTNLVAIPAILVYVLALLDKRKNAYNGKMSYKQGFVSGLIITLFVTLITPLAQYINLTYITPEYFTNVIEYATEHGEMSQSEAMNYFNLKNYIIQATISSPISGTITSAIVAIFTMKR